MNSRIFFSTITDQNWDQTDQNLFGKWNGILNSNFHYCRITVESFLNPLSANPTKWSNRLKQFVGNLPTNCLSVFDHFVKLAFKGLTYFPVKYSNSDAIQKLIHFVADLSIFCYKQQFQIAWPYNWDLFDQGGQLNSMYANTSNILTPSPHFLHTCTHGQLLTDPLPSPHCICTFCVSPPSISQCFPEILNKTMQVSVYWVPVFNFKSNINVCLL